MGLIFNSLGFIAATIGLILSLGIVMAQWGVTGSVVGFLIFPVALALVPWYAVFEHGNWLPLVMAYGGFILIMVGQHFED